MRLLGQAEFSFVCISASVLSAAFCEGLFPVFDQTSNPFVLLIESVAEITLHYALGIGMLDLLVPLNTSTWAMTAMIVFSPVFLPAAYQKMSYFIQMVTGELAAQLPDYSWSPPAEGSRKWADGVERDTKGMGAALQALTQALSAASAQVSAAIEEQSTALQTDIDARQKVTTAAMKTWADAQKRLKTNMTKFDATLTGYAEKLKYHISVIEIAINDIKQRSDLNRVFYSDLIKKQGETRDSQYDDLYNRLAAVLDTINAVGGIVTRMQAELEKDTANIAELVQLARCANKQSRNTVANKRWVYDQTTKKCEAVYIQPGERGYQSDVVSADVDTLTKMMSCLNKQANNIYTDHRYSYDEAKGTCTYVEINPGDRQYVPPGPRICPAGMTNVGEDGCMRAYPDGFPWCPDGSLFDVSTQTCSSVAPPGKIAGLDTDSMEHTHWVSSTIAL